MLMFSEQFVYCSHTGLRTHVYSKCSCFQNSSYFVAIVTKSIIVRSVESIRKHRNSIRSSTWWKTIIPHNQQTEFRIRHFLHTLGLFIAGEFICLSFIKYVL